MIAAGAPARALVRRARSAALATVLAGDGGRPYASLVTVAADTDASPILLLSSLSDHTRNLAADDRVSLLIEAASRRANPQTGPRVTLVGRIGRSGDERLRRRFLARHPHASTYAGFADFAVYRMIVERAHFVAGFAVARWIEGRDFRVDPREAEHLATTETEVLAHMNDDHRETLDLLASRLLNRRGQGLAARRDRSRGVRPAARGHVRAFGLPHAHRRFRSISCRHDAPGSESARACQRTRRGRHGGNRRLMILKRIFPLERGTRTRAESRGFACMQGRKI